VPRVIKTGPEAMLAELFLGPDEADQATSVTSSVLPSATGTIVGVNEQTGVAVVDLSAAALPRDNSEALAVGQIVFSLTEVEGITGVTLLVDNEEGVFRTQDGGSEPGAVLTRADFARFGPNASNVGPFEGVAPVPDPTPTTTPTPTPTPTP